MRPPRDEIHCVGRSGISYLRTLSPIIASPRGTPTSTFSLDSSTSHVHHGTQSPPTASLDSTLPHTSRSLSEALYSPSSLSTSTSYPAAVFLRTVHDVVAPQETRHHVRPMRPRSLSDSSLPSRLACHSLNSKQAGVSLRPDLQTNAEDTNTSFPRHRAKCHIPLDQNIEEDEGVPPLRSCQSAQNLEPFGYRNVKTGDVMRSFHALMELLTSERGYLNDLKALVQVSGLSPSQEIHLIYSLIDISAQPLWNDISSTKSHSCAVISRDECLDGSTFFLAIMRSVV